VARTLVAPPSTARRAPAPTVGRRRPPLAAPASGTRPNLLGRRLTVATRSSRGRISTRAARRPRCPCGAPRPGLLGPSGCGTAASGDEKRKSSSWSSSPATNEGSVGDDEGVDGDENMPRNRSPAGDQRVWYSSIGGHGPHAPARGSSSGGDGRRRPRAHADSDQIDCPCLVSAPSGGRARASQANWLRAGGLGGGGGTRMAAGSGARARARQSDG
jgi:hypothetical protein